MNAPPNRPLVVVPERDRARFAPLIPDGVALFGLVSQSDDEVVLAGAGGAALHLRDAPMLLVGFLAASPAALPALRALRDRFAAWSAAPFPDPVVLPSDRRDPLSAVLATALVARLQTVAAHAVRAGNELARLRAQHEDLHNAFAGVEAFLNAANVAPCTLRFENPPAEAAVALHGSMSQLLPVSSLGLSAIELFLAGSGTAAPDCRVVLRTTEDDAVQAEWTLRSEAAPGWVSLTLPRALGGLQRGTAIELASVIAGGVLPCLRLGAPQPLPRFRVMDAGGRAAAARSLALRCWTGLPGVTPPVLAMPEDLATRPGDAPVHEVALPLPALHGARLVSDTWQDQFAPVEFLPDLRGLACHPPPSGATIGRIAGFRAAEAIRLSARTGLRHPDGNPVEFALAFSTLPDQAVRAAVASGAGWHADGEFVWSGWQRVAHPDEGLLVLDVANILPGRADVIVATRMADGAPNDFAWATFYDLRATLLGAPPPSHPASDPAPFGFAGFGAPPGPAEIEPAPVEPAPVEPAPVEPSAAELIAAVQPAAGTDPRLVAHSSEFAGVFCHPPPGPAVSVAVLPAPLGPALRRVAARPHVANGRAQPVEFCMVLSTRSPDEVAALLRRRAALPPDCATSGWIAALPGAAPIAVARPPGSAPAHLCLATRMAEQDGTNDYAWCYFADLAIDRGDAP